MEILLIRAALAPCLVLVVSIVARRLGPHRGGQLLGAPTSTGPFLVLVCASHGPEMAAQATYGCVTGTLVVVCFCLAYARLAPSRRPAGTLLLALGCAAVAGLLGTLCGNVWLTAGLTAAVTVSGLLTWTADDQGHRRPDQSRARAWEIPMRMALSGVTVLTAVTAAGVLGSFVGGVLSALPVLLGIMAPSLHSSVGPPAAAGLLRGALGSAIGTLCFLLVLGVSLVPLGSVAAFAFALAAMLAARPLMRLVTPPTDH